MFNIMSKDYMLRGAFHLPLNPKQHVSIYGSAAKGVEFQSRRVGYRRAAWQRVVIHSCH